MALSNEERAWDNKGLLLKSRAGVFLAGECGSELELNSRPVSSRRASDLTLFCFASAFNFIVLGRTMVWIGLLVLRKQ